MPVLPGSAREFAAELAKRNLPKTFCTVPFTTLILEADGTICSCRHKGSGFVVGNLHEQSLDEIWNGPVMRKWRKEFLSGDIEICKTEVRHRACHLCPSHNALLPAASLQEEQMRPFLRLGLNLNGRCNLRCRMCHIWQRPNGVYDELGFWPILKRLVPDLREIELFSGEPFIQKDTYRLIELVSTINPACLWSITTNGHWKLTGAVKRYLGRIHLKSLIVSLDSLNPITYGLIRRGGRLPLVLANLDRLIEYDKERQRGSGGSLNIKVNFLFQKDNWMELASSLAFGKKKGVDTFRTFLYEPFQFSLLSLAEQEREKILDFYLSTLSREELAHSLRVILPLLDSLAKLSRCRFWLRLQERL